jgi:hypothetical protein
MNNGNNAMAKKPDITLIISLVSIVIASLALSLSFIEYSQSKAISFLWNVDSQNGIPIKLKQEHYKDEQGRSGIAFYIPIWIEFKIVNTGRATFSIDSIFVYTNTIKGTNSRQFNFLKYNLFQPSLNAEVLPKTKIMFPIVVEPGHSKIMLGKFDLMIPELLYKEYMNMIKGKEFTLGDIYRLSNKDLRIGRNYNVYAEVTLSGGKVKTVRVDIDGE